MNENSGATPNPLNPNPMGQPQPYGSASQAGMGQPMAGQSRMSPRPIQPVGSRMSINVNDVSAGRRPMGRPMMRRGRTPADAEASMNTMIQSLDPTGRPMEQVATVVEVEQHPEPKKKKTGLIVTIAVLAVLLIGGGVAAALLLLKNDDAVSKAMDKIMSGNVPTNVAIDGMVELRANSEDSPVESVKIDLNSGIARSSMANTSSAAVTLSIKGMDDVSFNFDEMYTDSGDLYLKLSGVSSALQSSGIMGLMSENVAANSLIGNTECESTVAEDGSVLECDTVAGDELTTNCVNDPSGMTNCGPLVGPTGPGETGLTDLSGVLTPMLGLVQTLDGQWLRISTDELSGMTSGEMTSGSGVSCITGLVSDLNTGSTSAAEAYKKNPFVTSTTDGLTINKKRDSLYKLSIDSAKFADFVNSMDNEGLASDVYACLKLENNVSMTAADVENIVNEFPIIYAEVNGDYNFTRLYLEGSNDEANMTTLIDLSFNYPDSLNLEAPNEYQDFSSVLQTLFMGMSGVEDGGSIVVDGGGTVVDGGGTVDGGEIIEEPIVQPEE